MIVESFESLEFESFQIKLMLVLAKKTNHKDLLSNINCISYTNVMQFQGCKCTGHTGNICIKL